MRIVKALLSVLAMACVLRVIWVPLYCYDLGFHLATGRYIWTQHLIPNQDPFSFTATTGIWPLHQWLMGLIFYGVYQVASFPGLIFFTVFMVAVLGGLLFLFGRKMQMDPAEALLMTAGILLIMQTRLILRPLLLSVILFCMLVMLVWDTEHGRPKWRQWAIAGVMMLWCHIHAAVVFGLFFIVVWAGATLLVHGSKAWRTVVDPLCAAFLGSVTGFLTVSLYNPGGAYGLFVPFIFFNEPYYREHLLEFLPVRFATDQIFFVVFSATAFFAILSRRSVRLHWACVWFFFGCLTLRVGRMIDYYAILCAPVWAGILQWVEERAGQRARASAMVLAAAFFLITFMCSYHPSGKLLTRNPMGNQAAARDFLNPRFIPMAAFDFVKTEGVNGRVFNEDAWGGWIAHFFYPSVQTFVDNRLMVFGTAFYQDIYMPLMRGRSGWEGVLARDHVEWMLLRRELSDAKIAERILREQRWSLIYFDDVAMIFVNREGINKEIARRRSIDSLKPVLSGDFFQTPEGRGTQLKKDLLEMAAREESNTVLNLLGLVSMREKDNAEAEQFFRRSHERNPCDVQALHGLSRLAERAGELDRAAQHLERALHCDPTIKESYLHLARLFEKEHFNLRSSRILRLGEKFAGPLI